MDRKIDFWGGTCTEVLSHVDKDVAIEYILDGMDEEEGELGICGYVRKELPKRESKGFEYEVGNVIENLLERLDEDYGGEDGTEITEEMREAGRIFISNMFKLYQPWQCEIVKKEVINIKEWITENRPDWLVKDNK